LTEFRYFYNDRIMKMNNPTDTSLEHAAQAFAALGSEQRLSVLRMLVRAGPDGMSIGALGTATGITGSTLTHHLKFLTHAGLLDQAKRGRSIICAAVAYDTVRELADFLLAQCCADQKGADNG